MKKIKSLLYIALVASVFSVALISCTPDPCKDVVCQNGGTCLEGTCDCAAGYFGTFCEGALAGNYDVTETGSASGASSYVVGYTVSGDAVQISNFWGIFVNKVNATTSGNTITIATQEPDSDHYFVSGTGTITTDANNKVNIDYTYSVVRKDTNDVAIISTDNVTGTHIHN